MEIDRPTPNCPAGIVTVVLIEVKSDVPAVPVDVATCKTVSVVKTDEIEIFK